MAKLKDIRGTRIQSIDADPVVYIGAWASGGTKNTIVNDGTGSGSNTAGLAFGGVAPPGITADTETYNGTSWTEVNNLNAGRRSLTGTGTQTASLAIAGGEAGSFTAAVEKWDGTNWTEVNDLNTARGYNPGSSGTTTAGLCFGGRVDPNPAVTAKTEYYNGTSWTEVNDLNTARYNGAGAGVFPSTLYAGGHSNSPPGATLTVNETWNGTSWTEASDLNTGRNGLGGTGNTNTSVLVFGGTPPETSKTESWNGTAWTEVADLAAPSEDFCSSAVGGGTSALRAAGNVSGARSGATEEWNFPPSTSTVLQEGLMWFNSGSSTLKGYQKASNVPSGTFASGGALNTARYTAGVCGVSTAAICAGGDFYVGPPNSPSDRSGTKTESYNGSTWTEVNDMNNDVQGIFSMAGTQTAGITNAAPDSPKVFIESWDGTSWTNSADLNTGLQERCQAAQGSQTASLVVGGTPPRSTNVEQWDGSSWTEIADINTARAAGRNTGTTSAQIFFGGNSDAQTNGDVKNESWNGTAWTEVGDLPVGRAGHTGLGSQTVAVTTQGNGPNSLGAPNPTGPNSSKALNFWNGTSWSADTDDAPYKARGSSGGGSATDGIICAGISDPNFTLTTTIEWNVDAAVGTISTS